MVAGAAAAMGAAGPAGEAKVVVGLVEEVKAEAVMEVADWAGVPEEAKEVQQVV